MKTKLLILLLVLGIGTGCKKEDAIIDERSEIEIINQNKAETAVNNFMKDAYKYTPVSFKRLKYESENDVYSIGHTYRWTGNNPNRPQELGKQHTSTYVFVINNDLSEVITVRENYK